MIKPPTHTDPIKCYTYVYIIYEQHLNVYPNYLAYGHQFLAHGTLAGCNQCGLNALAAKYMATCGSCRLTVVHKVQTDWTLMGLEICRCCSSLRKWFQCDLRWFAISLNSGLRQHRSVGIIQSGGFHCHRTRCCQSIIDLY